MTFRMESGNEYALLSALADAVKTRGIDRFQLVSSGELPMFEKYDEYVPAELLRKAYATDKICVEEAEQRILEFFETL